MRILIIAPHPDDEVLGCGGTMVKHNLSGDEVYLCIITKTYTPEWSEDEARERRKEVLRVNQILGIKKTYFLDLPTVKLDTIPQKELNERLGQVINEVQPEVVYIPHQGDINKDHQLVFGAAMVATRPIPDSAIKKVLCYEVLSETEWGAPFVESVFTPNVYVDISGVLETKLKAMSEYKSELKEFPHPRSLEAISALAKMRGTAAGVEAAEAFMLVREIWI
ncbi:MAG: PIG-L family deacetylase [Dehalococcoidia bacterium]|nr:MAG: PIG-L family deacetylase [Dehalococcoidia bacterium]